MMLKVFKKFKKLQNNEKKEALSLKLNASCLGLVSTLLVLKPSPNHRAACELSPRQ